MAISSARGVVPPTPNVTFAPVVRVDAASAGSDVLRHGSLFARVAQLLIEERPGGAELRAPRDPASAQALRLLRHRAAVASSVLALFVFAASSAFGMLDAASLGLIGCAVLASIVAFGWLFRTGYNLRFADPSLTVAQMTAATVVTFAAMYAADNGRSVFLLLVLMAFLFGVFKLGTRAMLKYAGFVSLAHATTIALLYWTRSQTLDLPRELLAWTVMAATLPWFALMASYIARLRGTIVDIDHEQRRTSHALHVSMVDLEEAQSIAHLGSFVFDPSSGRREWTREMYHMFGLPPGTPPPDNTALRQFVHPGDRARYVDAVQGALRDCKPFDLDFRILPASGGLRWVSARGVPVPDARGRPTLMRGTVLDITARKCTEDALRAAHDELAATKATLVNAIESLSDALALFDRDDRLVLCNSAYAQMFTRHEDFTGVAGMTFECVVRASLAKGELIDRRVAGTAEAWIRHRIDQHRNPATAPCELQLGNGRWVQTLERRTANGGVVGVCRDVTERKQSDQRQAMQHAVAGILAEAEEIEIAVPRIIEAICDTIGLAGGALWELDPSLHLLRCTGTWSVEDENVRGFFARSAQQSFTPESSGLIRRACSTADGVWIGDLSTVSDFQRRSIALDAGLHSAFAFPIITGARTWGVLEFYGDQPRAPDDALLAIARSVGSQIGQFIARVQAQARVLELAHFDPLTGLPNRSLFRQLLEGALQQAHPRRAGVSLLYIDLDGFKQVNDRHGHDAGDQLLVTFALRLRETLRVSNALGCGTTSAARIGGDEFIVLVEHASSTDVLLAVAERVLAAVAEAFDVRGQPAAISASIGISTYPDHGVDAESLLKSADRGMYAAKQAGKNRIAVAPLDAPATV